MASAQFGDVATVRDALVSIDRRMALRGDAWAWLQTLHDDLRQVMRAIVRRPLMPAMAIAMLALAVGATAAAFAVIDPMFFKQPNGVAHPGTLRRLFNVQPRMAGLEAGPPIMPLFDFPEYVAIRDATRGIARAAVDFVNDSVDVEYAGQTNPAGMEYVTSDYLPMLGVRMERGRAFTDAEDNVDEPSDVAVVSHTFAKRTFADSVDPLGQQLRVRGRVYRVIGVAANGFTGIGLSETSIWVPLSARLAHDTSDTEPWYRRRDIFLPIVVRLLPGTDARALEARATIAYRRTYSPPPPVAVTASILVAPIAIGRDPGYVTHEQRILTCIAGVALLLWIIACANVANLLLARAIARRREIGIRVALGISRRRLATFIGLEAIVIALTAAAVSVVLAMWAGGVLRTQLLPRVHWSSGILNVRLIVFTLIVALAAALFAGAAPALIVSRYGISDALKAGARDGSSNRARLRTAMLCVQAALATVLIVGSVLFGDSLHNVRSVHLGYDTDRVVVGSVYFRDHAKHDELEQGIPDIAARVGALPGVMAAAPSGGAPMSSVYGARVWRAGADSAHPMPNPGNYMSVAPDYFRIMGTRIIEGRPFTESDGQSGPHVMIVSTTMARRLWPGERALGRCLRIGSPSTSCYTVVGVAEDAHEFRIVQPQVESQYYVPFEQRPFKGPPHTVIARSSGRSADEIALALRRMLRERFPDGDVLAVPLARALEPELRPWVLGARVFAVLSAVALLVALLGVYAMVSFDSGQRTREIGVRLALGATRGSVTELLVRRGIVAVTVGVAIGAAVALASGKLVESLLFGIGAADPRAMFASAIVLLCASAAASLLPALRATAIDPVVVLRDE